jgi:predicted small lipoprotein YifL
MRVLILLLLATATACGQTGSLYLPDETIETPVEIRTSTPPPPAPSPENEDEDDQATKPPGR